MVVSDQYKVIGMISPQRVTSTSSPTGTVGVDTFGFMGGRLVVSINLGSLAGAVGTLSLQGSHDDTTYVDVLSVGTAKNLNNAISVLPTGDNDNSDHVFDILLEADSHRYYKIVYVNGGSSNYISATAFLFGRVIGTQQTDSNSTVRSSSAVYRTKGT